MRERQMLKLAVAMAMMCGLASASVVGYHVEPVKASWSGHTDTIPPNNYVSQTVVACWDTLERVELFAGAKGSGGTYRAGIWLDGHEVIWSTATQSQSESWVKFDSWSAPFAFTKGKTVTIRFTRGGTDSTQFYWAEDPNSPTGNGPYHYGHMIVGGQSQTTRDLAMRCLGRMNPVEFRGHNKRLLTAGGFEVEWGCGTLGSAGGVVGSSSRHSAGDPAAAGVLSRGRLSDLPAVDARMV
jgi:hypothetical protein